MRSGVTSPVWTYNGTVPGPLIRAEVGDTIIVHFRNQLPESTTIHWHGIRVPYEMDGVPDMPEPAVKPGGEFVYRFVADTAGTYWYHPHLNSSAQVGWGLYGALIVEDPKDSAAFGDDLVLVLSDMAVDDEGALNAADEGGQFGDLFGREGNLLLVNGRVLPHVKARAGKPQRWRIINAARARYFSFSMHEEMFTRIGTGNGLAERSRKVTRITLVPGERADVVFTPAFKPGSVATLQWLPVSRGYGTEAGGPLDLLQVKTVPDAPVVPAPIPAHLRDIERIDVSRAVQRTLEFTISTEDRRLQMGFNGLPYEHSIPIHAKVGEAQLWTIVNRTAFSHPFHLHGFSFQVVGAEIPEWRDTVDVAVNETVQVAVMFDSRPGMWMYHCHILDHAEAGMMGEIHLE